jgi:DNA-binding NtrC family response regulator/tetratricopeptide (TPR) repeat protein
MTGLKGVEAHIRAGRFTQALHSLTELTARTEDSIEVDALRAHLLERTGNYGQSRALCERLLGRSSLSNVHKSICETTLGIIKHDTADSEGGIVHFQRAVLLAQRAKDLQQTCWSQLRLMLSVADRSGPDGAVPILAQIRANAVKLGDPQISAALHIFVGEMEAKRGLVQTAQRHATLGQQLLGDAANLWLETRAEITLVAVAIMRSDLHEGLRHGQRALQLAEQCGSATLRRACLGNLGNLYYLIGRFKEAIEHLEAAHAVLPGAGEMSSGMLESLARVSLRQDRLGDAAGYLERIDESIASPSDWLLYANRHSELTRAELLDRQGSLSTALAAAERALDLATRAGDHLLLTLALLMKANLLRRSGRHSAAATILAEIEDGLPNYPPDVHAQFQRVFACALAAAGDERSGRLHFERARRIYEGLRHAPGLLDLDRAWNEVASGQVLASPQSGRASAGTDDGARGAANLLQNIAALMMHAGRPELLATGLVSILADSGSIVGATALSRANDGTVEILAACGEPRPSAGVDLSPERSISVGSAVNRTVEVRLRPRADIESAATLNAVTILVGVVRDLERAHAEREERETLWPVEEIPTEGEQAVVTGRMRELMSFVRRVAGTTVGVLITGESGTGKEILARAIHRYSARAERPFVPFNCTAIPREMLESQLFGHRRGAFTGADRDNAGLIRSAKDGTLFLDEIGELGLDLQPKLLRFLESGEICPLGEPNPFIVDVRIIAATNSNLEQLVQDGRFREDLFYRLNVIRLAIPPLRERRDEVPPLVHHFVARAAAEFSKGRIRVTEETMEHLLLYPWPGNIRQLNNELRRMVALAEVDAVLTPSSLSLQVLRATPKAAPRSTAGQDIAVPLHDKLMPTLSRVEREMIRVALGANHGRLEAAAKALGISRKGLYLKRQRLGL